jgi:hypothetical protein
MAGRPEGRSVIPQTTLTDGSGAGWSAAGSQPAIKRGNNRRLDRRQKEKQGADDGDQNRRKDRHIHLPQRQRDDRAMMVGSRSIRMKSVMQCGGSGKDLQREEQNERHRRVNPAGIPVSQREPCHRCFHRQIIACTWRKTLQALFTEIGRTSNMLCRNH